MKLTSQRTSYNLKLTKDELQELARVINGEYVHVDGAWQQMIDLIRIEAKHA